MHRITPFDHDFVSTDETRSVSSVETRSLRWAGSCYQGRQEASSGHVSILADVGQDAISTPDSDSGPDEGDPREKEPNRIANSLIHLAAPGLSWLFRQSSAQLGASRRSAPPRPTIICFFGSREPEIVFSLIM